jgi:hypothetical protein
VICPACKTNNTNPLDAQYCIQCGSDLYVHRLLREISEAIQMKSEITKTEQESPKKLTWLFVVWQIVSVILLMTCAMFGIFVGMRFLAFIDHEESYRISVADKYSEIVFEQLQQMSTTIKQEFDLILDQRQENQALQARIQELTAAISNNTEERTMLSSNVQGKNH